MPSKARNASRTIAGNSLWFGAETAAGIVLLFATSIPLARIIGPERLGYYNYVAWLTTMSTTLGGLGIPAMASKFIAEHLGRNENGIARRIFKRSLVLQTILSVIVTGISLAIALVWGDPQYRTVTALQVLSIFPGMLLGVPALANLAAERLKDNVPGSLASSFLYLIGTTLSLSLGWGLAGVSISFLVGRLADLFLKMRPCLRHMSGFPEGVISPELNRQMRSFAWEQLVLMVLGLIVWDRSDVIILKFLSKDLKQITFFTLAYNLSEKVLLVPRVFGTAISASLMAQFGRDRARLNDMVVTAARYMYLAAAPLLGGIALVSGPLIRLLYGKQYLPVIPILTTGALFAVLKAVIDPPDSMLRANNRQAPGIYSSIVCAVINIGIDWMLVPAWGAMGAAIGNGVAQSLHVICYWAICMVLFKVRIDFAPLARVTAATAAMAIPILFFNRVLPPGAALAADVVAGAIVFLTVLRLTSFFNSGDRKRFDDLWAATPAPLQPFAGALLRILMPRAALANAS